MANKKDREIIFNKYGGRCAYCGAELQKGWHVDELLPIKRNTVFDKNKNKWVFDGTCEHPERLNIDNQMPSCPSCNINKHSMSLEEFRSLIEGFMKHLNEINTQYKIAKRYGLVTEDIKPVVFYFEREALNTMKEP
jgi:5-methylcytosine-specific restriction endonuclease McrA